MANDLLTAAKVAQEIGVSDAAVKKAIKELGIQPDAKKGPCNYYGPAAVAKIKKAVKK